MIIKKRAEQRGTEGKIDLYRKRGMDFEKKNIK